MYAPLQMVELKAVARYISYDPVRLSVCLSHCSIISAKEDLWSRGFHQTV